MFVIYHQFDMLDDRYNFKNKNRHSTYSNSNIGKIVSRKYNRNSDNYYQCQNSIKDRINILKCFYHRKNGIYKIENQTAQCRYESQYG